MMIFNKMRLFLTTIARISQFYPDLILSVEERTNFNNSEWIFILTKFLCYANSSIHSILYEYLLCEERDEF
jgi:hypothetical protein